MSNSDVIEIRLKIIKPRPTVDELINFLWGETHNYDSDGDCNKADDTMWTILDVTNRSTGLGFSICDLKSVFLYEQPLSKETGTYRVSSNDIDTALKVAYFLWKQCDAEFLDKNQEVLVKQLDTKQ